MWHGIFLIIRGQVKYQFCKLNLKAIVYKNMLVVIYKCAARMFEAPHAAKT